MNFRPYAASILIVSVLTGLAGEAGAVKFGLAERTDTEIVNHVSGLMSGLENVPPERNYSAVYLEYAEMLELKSTTRSTNNRLLYVLDPSDEDLLTRTEYFGRGMKIVGASAFVIRAGGDILHLADRDVRILEDDDQGQAPHVVIGFPSVEASDILGWTVILEDDSWRLGSARELQRDHWVAQSRLLLDMDEDVGFVARLHNVRKDLRTVKSARERRGRPTVYDVRVRDLPPFRNDEFSPVPPSRRPYVEIAVNGVYNPYVKTWLMWDTWSSFALAVDGSRADRLKADSRMKELVKELCEGLDSVVDRADRIHRYVRDEVRTIYSFEQRGGDASARDVLRDGVGTPFDKATLMTAMCRRAGIDARIAYARNRHFGSFDHGNAGFWQVTDLVVWVMDPASGRGFWYVPGEEGCPPRTLPPALRDTEVVFFEEDLDDELQRIRSTAFAKHNRSFTTLYRYFREQIRGADWYELRQTTGDPYGVAASCVERRQFDIETGEGSITLEVDGRSPWAIGLHRGEDLSELVGDYQDARGIAGSIVDTPSVEREPAGGPALLRWAMKDDVPDRMGDVCILPATLVFGEPLVSFWEGPDRGTIFTDAARIEESITEIRVPEGATLAELPPPLTLRNPLFDYESTIAVEGPILTVHRKLSFKPGFVEPHAMGVLEEDIRRVLDFDSQSLVLSFEDGNPE